MMSTEVWKSITGFEGRYEVSNHGRVRSTPKRQPGRILKPGKQSKKYLTVALYLDVTPKQQKSFLVHKLVMAAFGTPQPTEKHQVNHKDLDKTNNHIDNLEWVTCAENIKHAAKSGCYSGARNGRHRLTEAQVEECRRRLSAENRDRREASRLAAEFGVSAGHIRDIASGKYWKDSVSKEKEDGVRV